MVTRTLEASPPESDWADLTRRVLTRDLLLQAARAQPAERHALQFRALHLNLALVDAAADRLALTPRERNLVEHDALGALAEALGSFDPYGEHDFADVAPAYVDQAMLSKRRLG